MPNISGLGADAAKKLLTVPRRRGWLRCAAFAIVGAAVASIGCADHKSQQYFAVRDEDTGAVNYYRMTIKGGGAWGVDYKMQAGYFSAASVDVLRGQMPKIAELDLPVEQLEVFDRALEEFYGFVLEQAKAVACRSDPEVAAIVSKSISQFAKARQESAEAEIEILNTRRDLRISARDDLKKDLDDEMKVQVQLKEERASIKAKRNTARDELAKAQHENAPTSGETTTNESEEDSDNANRGNDLEEKQRTFRQLENDLSDKDKELTNSRLRIDSLKRQTRALVDEIESVDNEIARYTVVKNRFAAAAATAAERASKLAEAYAKDGTATGSIVALTPDAFEDRVRRLARFVWYTSLSSADVASIGMTESSNPYEFRKLVFWATAKNLDLNQFGGEIDAVIDNATGIGLALKTNHEQRKAAKEQEAQARHKQIQSLLDKVTQMPGLGDQQQGLQGMIQMLEAANPLPIPGGDIDKLLGGIK